ncbi:MAG TPA: hypothetical protein VIO57_10185 [Chloroflexota bacterium]|jgi:hypothetical protein
MPFDNTLAISILKPRKCEAEIRLIEELEALFVNPANWCRNAWHITHMTRKRKWWWLRAVTETWESFCLIGGLAYLTDADPWEIDKGYGPPIAGTVRARLRKLGGEYVPTYNDNHDHAEILALLAAAKSSFIMESF